MNETTTSEMVRVCVTLGGGWYLAFVAKKGRPWSQGARECQASPVFLDRSDAVAHGKRCGYHIVGE